MHGTRRGVTLLELIIVLVIIAGLLALLVPAVMSSREKAREAVCKNNLHQLGLALAQLHETAKELPLPPLPGKAGGWTVEILPYLEQRPLYDQLSPNVPVLSLPESSHKRPPAMRCPVTAVGLSNAPPLEASHFVLAPAARRESWYLFDSPTGFQQPWLTGPEMQYDLVTSLKGPHHGGFHIAAGDGSVRLIIKPAARK